MNGELLQLFPTPVGRLAARTPTDTESDILKHFCSYTESNNGNLITQNKRVLDTPELSGLRNDLTAMVNEYFQAVYIPKTNVNLYITSSWCNISYVGNNHHSHVHHNSILSGVYYLEAESSDTITFVRGLEQKLALVTYPEQENPFNMLEYNCPVMKNMLVLFPSTLMHLVKPLRREGPRVSLSFNTFATGDFGDVGNLTNLSLK